MFSFLQHVISLAILYLYPSYRSYKALENKNVTDAQEWLCYWIVTGILTIPILFSNTILNWVPFYYEIKLAFCFWLILPQTKGHLALFNKYVIPYMDRFSGRIDKYASEITELSKKYAAVAWQKGMEIAQTKFVEVLTKGPSALFDFSNISFNFGNKQTMDSGRIREINDDDEEFDDDNDNYTMNNYRKNRNINNKNSNQMIVRKKRSNINRSNALSESNNIKIKRSFNRENEEFDYNKRNIQRTPSFRKNNQNNSPYSSRYDDNEIDDYNNEENSAKSNNSLFMSMLSSNHRPGPGGMMGINDVYSSESDHSNSNSNHSNDENYFDNEEIDEKYNYNKNNVYYGTNQRRRMSKVNQYSNRRDNYYDYDYDLTREDDDTINDNDLYGEEDSYSESQKRRITPKIANEKKNPDYQQSFLSNFNSFFH